MVNYCKILLDELYEDYNPELHRRNYVEGDILHDDDDELKENVNVLNDDEYFYNDDVDDIAFADICIPEMIDVVISKGLAEGIQHLKDRPTDAGFKKFRKRYQQYQDRL